MKNPKPILFLILCILLANFQPANAAFNDDPVLIRIEDKEISVSEFEEIYRKSNIESVVAEPKSVEEYLEMYIDFRLKVLEAMNLGLDTNSSFVDELAGYRQQLAQQYLIDNKVTDQLLHEAYERSRYDIRASHILLNLNEHAPPADTLAVYEQLMDIRERALAGESFADLAREYSDDPSARDREATQQQPGRRGNAGDLGYFTVFNMVYPFESAAYNTPVGEISLPARTSFGYHLVKVTDRLPAMGSARVAHIMLMTPPGMAEEELTSQKEMINELYQEIQEGADFEELAQEYSEDRQSAQNNGEMPAFTSNRMVPQFIKAISEMHEPGEIKEPVRTDFGWHIIKLLEKIPPKPFEEIEGDLRNRIQRDARSQLGQEVVIERLKNEYDMQNDMPALEALYDLIDESVFMGQWECPEDVFMDDPLFSFANQTYSQQDFLAYVEENQRRQNPMEIVHYVHKMFDRFVNSEILSFENSQLEYKYPDFRRIMQEYHDGILLFEITDQMVWSKATSDTTALRSFYDEYAGEFGWGSFEENRGAVIAEYQNYLEKNWLVELREKYEVFINRELLQAIKEE